MAPHSASTPDQPHLVELHPEWAHRTVTLICGPPGSGKSTLARQLHPYVVELENFHFDTYRANLRAFGLAAYKTGRNPLADVAVVRGAPSAADRQHQQELCRPARTIILLTPPDLCHARITQRARPEAAGEHAAVDKWWSTYNGVKMPSTERAHYTGDYDKRAATLRAHAYANPDTRCGTPGCGRTLAEHGPGATWDAGHVRDGDPTSPLRPEVAACNRSAGATAGNRKRAGLVPTRAW